MARLDATSVGVCMRIVLPLVTAVLLVSGCASTTIESKAFKSYQVGQEKTATIGDVFLIDQTGYITKTRQWVGIMNSPDGWKVTDVPSIDYMRKELLYSGRSGNTIKVGYREYRGGLAAQAFYQALEYDLSASRTITFQKFRMHIVAATNEKITYVVLND